MRIRNIFTWITAIVLLALTFCSPILVEHIGTVATCIIDIIPLSILAYGSHLEHVKIYKIWLSKGNEGTIKDFDQYISKEIKRQNKDKLGF